MNLEPISPRGFISYPYIIVIMALLQVMIMVGNIPDS